MELHSVRSHLSTQHSLAVLLELSLACKPQVVMSHRLDDPSALLSLLQQWTAPPEVKSRLEASGFTTLGLLGHALPSADKEDVGPGEAGTTRVASAACGR